ncbi:MAG: pyridoxamine 5'-phosphate oxidase family protein [Pseudomonadota bacterium]
MAKTEHLRMSAFNNPFHDGEVEAQQRVGIDGLAERVGSFIRDHMPQQHRTFFSSLPFVVVAAQDERQRPWVTIIEGLDGFITTDAPHNLSLRTTVHLSDPLATAFDQGTDVGMLGIELDTRRRNRMNGNLRKTATGYDITVGQSFGNCPQYINKRHWHRVGVKPGAPIRSTALNKKQTALIRASDTMFIGSGHREKQPSLASGYDASHRGGAPGFVEVINDSQLRIPDYAGNNFFNTIGNILKNPSVALLFVDFKSGGLLHLSGTATINWNLPNPHKTGAMRSIEFKILQVIERPAALSLRWRSELDALRELTLLRKVEESKAITSFYFAATDGLALPDYRAGQYLPIELPEVLSQGRVKRSYSLSAAANGVAYRLSIKREPQGLASRFMHDNLKAGDTIEAGAAAGSFVLPPGNAPVVLVSAGVGITPVMAMLQQIVLDGSSRPVWFIHSARNGASHALKDELHKFAGDSVKVKVFYTQPAPEDIPGVGFGWPLRRLGCSSTAATTTRQQPA